MSRLKPVLQALLPRACGGCNANFSGQGGFCPICAPVVEPLSKCCQRCAEPMGSSEERKSRSLCTHCVADPPNFQRAFALFTYDGAVADCIRRTKYGGDLQALHSLCLEARPLMPRQGRELPKEITSVVMPSHSREIRKRGFHVPSLIARHLSELLPPKERFGQLVKTRSTSQQASLGYERRSLNVAEAFAWKGRPSLGGPILLIDDVMTTGATVREATVVLQAAGYDEVYVLLLARAQRLAA